MTIREALAARVPFVRLPHWHTGVYLALPLLPDGIGPWIHLHDPFGAPDGPVPLLTTTMIDDAGYEPAVPPERP